MGYYSPCISLNSDHIPQYHTHHVHIYTRVVETGKLEMCPRVAAYQSTASYQSEYPFKDLTKIPFLYTMFTITNLHSYRTDLALTNLVYFFQPTTLLPTLFTYLILTEPTFTNLPY